MANALDRKYELVQRPTAKLVPYAKNARTHSQAQVGKIAASIEEFGFTNPVLIDEQDGIIAGHGRVMAAQLLGLPTVPCIVLTGLTPNQRRAYVLADNKIALESGWDKDLLSEELEALSLEGYDLSLTGFNENELLNLLESDNEETGADETPPPPVIPASQAGDVWLCGDHRVMCGDSTDPAAVAALCGGGVALWITDPPYNVAYVGKTAEALKIQNDSMSDTAFRQFLVDAYKAADAAMKPGAVFYVWHADSEGYNFRAAAQDAGWQVRQCLVWNKNSMVMGRQDYQWKHEPCLYGWKEGAAHHWGNDRAQTTVLDFKRPSRNGEHPTMKPVELFAYQIANSSRSGDIVLDSFGGSGTTMIACEQLGRRARLMELDPVYVDVIVRRWQQFTGKKATRENDGILFDDVQPREAVPLAA